jgi:hypothetical protein
VAKHIYQQGSVIDEIEHGPADPTPPPICRHSANEPLNAWVLQLPVPTNLQCMPQTHLCVLGSLCPYPKAGRHQLDGAFECRNLPALI